MIMTGVFLFSTARQIIRFVIVWNSIHLISTHFIQRVEVSYIKCSHPLIFQNHVCETVFQSYSTLPMNVLFGNNTLHFWNVLRRSQILQVD